MRLILLDRDGVINEDRPDSVKSVEEFRLIAGSAAAIARLNAAGVKVAVVTNQSIVGRGTITAGQLEMIHDHMRQLLAQEGARVDAIFVAPDHPDEATDRRKPGAGMLREALVQFNAHPEQTPMVGDALRDIQAAAMAGCPRYLVRTGKGAKTQQTGLPDAVQPVAVVDDLAEAVERLL